MIRHKNVLVLAAACLAAARPLAAQGTPDPREVQPERPTVATHAHTVAPGFFEVETGVEVDGLPGDARLLSTPTVLKVGLGSHTQLNVGTGLVRFSGGGGPARSGIGDLMVGVKWRLLDGAPLLGDFAVIPAVKLPTGSRAKGTGTGTTDLSLLLISSHDFGPVAVDVNAEYTRGGGDGTRVPRSATLWTVSSGFPLHGVLGAVAEVFGTPGTSGPAGMAPSVSLLAGPTVQVRPWLALDAGVIRRLHGPRPNAVYTGLVYNLGRLPVGRPTSALGMRAGA
jgi:hypothetical protein